MVATLRFGSLASLIVLATALGACDRRPRGDQALAPIAPRFDAQSGDASRAPTAADTAPQAFPAARAPLRGFQCTRRLDPPKMPQGPLTVRFRPNGATDFTYHVEFHCNFNCRPEHGPCDYAADIRTRDGVLQGKNVPPARVGCLQSSVDPLAFDCAGFLSSDVETVVSARGVNRYVRFHVLPFFNEQIPDQKRGDREIGCLPFVAYDKRDDGSISKHLISSYFTFKPEECRLD
jgi:hypothetical protein